MIEGLLEDIEPYFKVERVEKERGVYVIVGTFNEPMKYCFQKVKEVLKEYGFTGIFQKNREGLYTITVGMLIKRRDRGITPLHIILLFLTLISTLAVGALHEGVDIFRDPLLIYRGIPFSFSLLLILGGHELGHYFTCKKFGIVATPPYFIPFPHPLVGTMGAFIKMKSPVPDRRALLWTGGMGPLVGFLLSIVVLIIGLPLSRVVGPGTGEGGIHLGTPLSFWILQKLLIPVPSGDYNIILHPMAFAGWIGMFVTALNLIPLGQLDGGHIFYALFGRKRIIFQIPVIIFLFILGFFWAGWWFWLILVSILGLKHPPVLDEITEFERVDYLFALVILMILIFSFIPVPFRIMR